MTASDRLREYSSYSATSATGTPAPTSSARMDEMVARLRQSAKEFATLPIEQKLVLVEAMKQGYVRVAERSVQAGCSAKGIAMSTPSAAEEWATGPWGIVRQLRLLGDSLRAISQKGNTPIGKVGHTAEGTLAVNVFPNNAIDGMLFKDVTVDVHLLGTVTEASLASDRASFYKKPDHQGRVALVLGAGNIAAIGVMDVITKMFNEGKVCVLKMNPVNAYLGPFIEEAFKSAIDRNYLAVAYGGVEVGRHLVYHPDIDEVHLTGSDKTHDHIVWGPPGPEQETRRKNNDPLLRKSITSELGNISPVIIVPGPYTDQEIAFQAETIASAMTMNASFLCNSAKMLITPKGWPGSAKFLKAIQDICAKVEPRQAYYPGAEDRWKTLVKSRPSATLIGTPRAGALPWSFIGGLDPSDENETLFHEEPFCSMLSEVQVGSADPVAFLDKAVEFANSRLWGTLNATLVVHPSSQKDPAVHPAFERAIARLRYGTVAINTFPGLSFVFGSPPWGAYPGSGLDNIQSGTGFVHNTPMLPGIEKAVIRAPLTVFPKPAFLCCHRTGQTVLRRLVAMEETASWAKVPGVVWAAMQG